MEKLFEGELKLLELLWDAAPVNSTRLVGLAAQRLGWTKSTTYTVLRKLCQKGAAKNEDATVTARMTREQVIREQTAELERRAGGTGAFLTTFLSGRRLTPQQAQELKELIDRSMGEE